MEPMGLVSRVAGDLERLIAQDRLPRDGRLPSERLLTRQYGVSRTTVREALSHLASRGLIVQHPGRRSRAVVLDETVNLETLGVALQGEGPAHPERSRLLEGFLALKRELTVELLALCGECASKEELNLLANACLALRDAARWEENRGQWAGWEFELLRRAARVADRPGHVLLIHSLERSFWKMASRVLPHLDSEAICRWAECAFYALVTKDVQALRKDLLPLLEAGDERLLGCRERGGKKADSPTASPAEVPDSLNTPSEAIASGATPFEASTVEATASESAPPEPVVAEPLSSVAALEVAIGEEATSDGSFPAALTPEVTRSQASPTEPSTPVGPISSERLGAEENSAPEVSDKQGLAGVVWTRWSDCQTSSYETTSAGAPSPEPDGGWRSD